MGIIKGIQDSYRIAVKDLLEFERNRMGLVFLFLMPFFMLIMTGFIFPTGSSYTDIPVAVVDLDQSQASQMFMTQMLAMNDKTNMMEFSNATSTDAALTLIKQGQVYGAIVIQPGFSSDMAQGKQGIVTVYSDNSIPQISMVMQGLGAQVVGALGGMKATMQVQTLAVEANKR